MLWAVGVLMLLVVALWWWWSSRRSARPHSAHFLRLQRALKDNNVYQPSIIIDKTRLLDNLRLVAASSNGRALRVVVKSLPCPQLLALAMHELNTRLLMMFNAAFIPQIVEHFPECHILFGKPMLVTAFERFHQYRNVVWLVDSVDRLQRYIDTGHEFQCALEVDVGLHRGGFSHLGTEFSRALSLISASPRVVLSGLMGYDAHAHSAPSMRRELANVLHKYQWFIGHFDNESADRMIFNTGGSHTLTRLLRMPESRLCNEFSVGSALVSPGDFISCGTRPAMWLAAPVLKVQLFQVPLLPWLANAALRLVLPRYAVYIYGGKWMASLVSPNMRSHLIFPASSNQSAFQATAGHQVAPGDWMFFLPSQSEHVMLCFMGDILVLHQDSSCTAWPTLKLHTQ